jgi:hypothetical protein
MLGASAAGNIFLRVVRVLIRTVAHPHFSRGFLMFCSWMSVVWRWICGDNEPGLGEAELAYFVAEVEKRVNSQLFTVFCNVYPPDHEEAESGNG